MLNDGKKKPDLKESLLAIGAKGDFEPDAELVQQQVETLLALIGAAEWEKRQDILVALAVCAKVLEVSNGWTPVKVLAKNFHGRTKEEVGKEIEEALANGEELEDDFPPTAGPAV